MSEWYEEWFNTDEYLNVYKHRNEPDAKKLVELILNNIEILPDAEILDLACGAGRHSILFAASGFKVTGVDLSKRLLKVAHDRAVEEGLKLDLVQSDIRYLKLNKQFKLAVNLFTSFGYFEEDAENYKLFESACAHLEAGGYFVIDYFNKNYLLKNLIPSSTDYIENGRIVQNRRIENGRVIKDISIERNGLNRQYQESVKLYNAEQIKEVLQARGFQILNVFGDFDGQPFNQEISKRLIIISKK